MSEPLAADRWIVDTLKADSTLIGPSGLVGTVAAPRIYKSIAPQGATFPYILFQLQGAMDHMVVGTYRVWTNMLYVIRGVAATTSWAGNLEIIAERIDLALHGKEGSTVEGTVHSCVRESPFQQPEVSPTGQVYYHNGGMYRIFAKAA